MSFHVSDTTLLHVSIAR